MRVISRTDVIPASVLLVFGRTAGFAASFAIPVVLARLFDRAEFGTYKQLFLIYGTFYGLAQIGMAESLYFFIPQRVEEAGRCVANALAMLVVAAVGCTALLWVASAPIAAWLGNPQLTPYLSLVAACLGCALVSSVFEIAMVSRKAYAGAAIVYGGSDIVRTAFLLVPAVAFGLRGVLAGATAFAAVRLLAMLFYLRREFGPSLQLDAGLWRRQVAYALPFGLAVGIDVIQANLHQYFVASRFSPETFAIYAVGCLQIPLVDLICTSTANVMMVKMADEGGQSSGRIALQLWHDTSARLASIIFPLAALLLLTAQGIIVTIFTTRYLPSVPIFMIWCTTILPAAFPVDAMLRAFGRTRFLLIMNIVRLGIIVFAIGWSMSRFGLAGAVLVTFLSTTLVKSFGVAKIARTLNVGLSEILPWGRLTMTACCAVVAVMPALWVSRVVVAPPPVSVVVVGTVYTLAYGLAWWCSRRWERTSGQAMWLPLRTTGPADGTD